MSNPKATKKDQKNVTNEADPTMKGSKKKKSDSDKANDQSEDHESAQPEETGNVDSNEKKGFQIPESLLPAYNFLEKYGWMISTSLSCIFGLITIILDFALSGFYSSNAVASTITEDSNSAFLHLLHFIFMMGSPALVFFATKEHKSLMIVPCTLIPSIVTFFEMIMSAAYLSRIVQEVFGCFNIILLFILGGYSIYGTRFNFHFSVPIPYFLTELLLGGMTVSLVSVGVRLQPILMSICSDYPVAFIPEQAFTVFFMISGSIFAFSSSSIMALLLNTLITFILLPGLDLMMVVPVFGVFSGLGIYNIVYLKVAEKCDNISYAGVKSKYTKRGAALSYLFVAAFYAIPMFLLVYVEGSFPDKEQIWVIFPISAAGILAIICAAFGVRYWFCAFLIPLSMALLTYTMISYLSPLMLIQVATAQLLVGMNWYWASFKVCSPLAIVLANLALPIITIAIKDSYRFTEDFFVFMMYYDAIGQGILNALLGFSLQLISNSLIWAIPISVSGPATFGILIGALVIYIIYKCASPLFKCCMGTLKDCCSSSCTPSNNQNRNEFRDQEIKYYVYSQEVERGNTYVD